MTHLELFSHQNLTLKRNLRKGDNGPGDYSPGLKRKNMRIKIYNYPEKNTEIADIFLSSDPDNENMLYITEYQYGSIVSAAIKPYLKNEVPVYVCVYDDSGKLRHELNITYSESYGNKNCRIKEEVAPDFGFQKRTERLPDVYLINVDPSKNLNDYYKIADIGAGKFAATSGRIGEKQGAGRRQRHAVLPSSYPDRMYFLKILEKELNGYHDKSECHSIKKIISKKHDTETSGIPDEEIADLMSELIAYARHVIESNYTVSYTDVTDEMIKQAKDVLDIMRRSSKSIDTFNHNLIELMRIIPRKIDKRDGRGVKMMLAQNASDMGRIMERETDLLSIMSAQIEENKIDDTKKQKNILEELGLKITRAKDSDIETVKSLLGDLSDKLSAVYRVENIETEKKFNEYLSLSEKKNGSVPDTKLLWHGSRNENWFHIMQQGLLLNPNAAITGKMFGQGIYFAPSAKKSWGYTSYAGSYWARGTSNTAFMGLYKTAYGKPFVVYDTGVIDSGFTYKDLERKAPGCGCVHAKADRGMLRNDEIIFYREDQITIKYLCKFNK